MPRTQKPTDIFTDCNFTGLKNALENACQRFIDTKKATDKEKVKIAENIKELLGNETYSIDKPFIFWSLAFQIFYYASLNFLAEFLIPLIREENVFSAYNYQLALKNFSNSNTAPMNKAMQHLLGKVWICKFNGKLNQIGLPAAEQKDFTAFLLILKLILPTVNYRIAAGEFENIPYDQIKNPHEFIASATANKEFIDYKATITPQNIITLTNQNCESLISNILKTAKDNYEKAFGHEKKFSFFWRSREKIGITRNKRIEREINELSDGPTKPVKLIILMLAALENGSETPQLIVLRTMQLGILTLAEIQAVFYKTKLTANIDQPANYCINANQVSITLLKEKLQALLSTFYPADHNKKPSAAQIKAIANTLETTDKTPVWPDMPENIQAQIPTAASSSVSTR